VNGVQALSSTPKKETLSSREDLGTLVYKPPDKKEQISEKLDMYALGIVLFELWQKFETAMKRVKKLKDLRENMNLPEKIYIATSKSN